MIAVMWESSFWSRAISFRFLTLMFSQDFLLQYLLVCFGIAEHSQVIRMGSVGRCFAVGAQQVIASQIMQVGRAVSNHLLISGFQGGMVFLVELRSRARTFRYLLALSTLSVCVLSSIY